MHLPKLFVGILCWYSGRYVDSLRSEEYERMVNGAIVQDTLFIQFRCARYAEDLLLLRTSGQELTFFPLCLLLICDNCKDWWPPLWEEIPISGLWSNKRLHGRILDHVFKYLANPFLTWTRSRGCLFSQLGFSFCFKWFEVLLIEAGGDWWWLGVRKVSCMQPMARSEKSHVEMGVPIVPQNHPND